MTPPNILIVMTDHQRADTVLPDHPALTPNLTRFAQQGITFTHAFCPSPHCCPSRATFFTGLYPSGHGVWNNVCNDMALSRGLKAGVRTWSEDLSEAGYRLAFSGKWHVSVEEGPSARGFREYFVSGGKGDLHGVDWKHYLRQAQDPEPIRRAEGQILRPGYGAYTLYGTSDASSHRHDLRTLDGALAALRDLGSSSSPWCLYTGFLGPHDPYVVPQEYLDRYDLEKIELPPSFADPFEDKPHLYQRMRQQLFGQLCEREVREAIRHYYAYCSYLDDLFGRILAALEATGQADNTLVIYCADHGDYCGDHGLFTKGIPCFQGAYRVPLVMRWPKGIREPGRQVDAFVSLADFAPTLIELAGVDLLPEASFEAVTVPIEKVLFGEEGAPLPRSKTDTLPAVEPDGLAPRHFAGRSLVPFLSGQAPRDWRDEIHTQCNGVELYYCQRSVMTREFKYTFNGFDYDELYDLRSDPHELVNCAGDPAYAAVKRDLVRRMWRFAYQQNDAMINPYITVGLAPWGPAEAFGG